VILFLLTFHMGDMTGNPEPHHRLAKHFFQPQTGDGSSGNQHGGLPHASHAEILRRVSKGFYTPGPAK
jgi:hypothetical protein